VDLAKYKGPIQIRVKVNGPPEVKWKACAADFTHRFRVSPSCSRIFSFRGEHARGANSILSREMRAILLQSVSRFFI